jgi:hypothetical protein
MHSRMISMPESKLVTVAVSATRPTTAGDGVAVTSWQWPALGNAAPSGAVLFLDASEALTLASPTGGSDGPEVWGYRLSTWWRLGYLNNSIDIVIVGPAQGFAAELNIIGVFDRLAIAGTPSAGTVTASIAPINEWQVP